MAKPWLIECKKCRSRKIRDGGTLGVLCEPGTPEWKKTEEVKGKMEILEVDGCFACVSQETAAAKDSRVIRAEAIA